MSYQLGRCDGDILDFTPTHQQIVPNLIWLPAVNLQRVMRSREDTMSFIMESDSSAKKRKKYWVNYVLSSEIVPKNEVMTFSSLS